MCPVPIALLVATLASAGNAPAEAPEVAHFTCPGPEHNELWMVLGHGFVPGKTRVLCHVLPAERPDEKDLDAWAETIGKPPLLPATPPAKSRSVEIVDETVDTLVLRGIPRQLPLFVFWVKTPSGTSRPQLVNRPEPYWVGRPRMHPDEVGMLFGKRCRVEGRFGLVALKPTGGGRPVLAEAIQVHLNRTGGIAPFRVPAETPLGRYELWFHNGHGGRWGWGGPLPLEIVAKPPAPLIVDARSYGVKGDGFHDDTAALQKALDAAAAKVTSGSRAIVSLAPGTYNIHSTVCVPEHVTLRGSGIDVTVLRGVGYDPYGPRRHWSVQAAMPAAVVQLISYAGLREVTITGHTAKGVGTGTVQMQERRLTDEVVGASMRRCKVIGYDGEHVSSYGMYFHTAPDAGLRCGPAVRDIDVYYCTFKNARLVFGRVIRRLRCVGNDVMGISGRCFMDSYIARNHVHGYYKGFTMSVWPASNFHNLYALNKVSDVASGREGSDGEEFCVHGLGGTEFGRRVAGVRSAAATSVTVTAGDWARDQLKWNHVTVLSGRGRGQYRLITGNVGATLTIDRPWNVVPDRSSRCLVAGVFAENTYLHNRPSSGSWVLLYKGQIANVVEGHETDRSAGISILTNDTSRKDQPDTATHLSLGWYNEIRGCLLDHTSVRLWLMCDDRNLRRCPTQMGNKVIRCTFRSSLPNHNSFTGSRSMPIRRGLQGAIQMGIWNPRSERREAVPADPHVWVAYTFIERNAFADTPVGVAVPPAADRTFITENDFWRVGRPLVDLGRGTRFWRNSRQAFDDGGRRYEPLPDQRPWRPARRSVPPSSGSPPSEAEAALGANYFNLIMKVDELVAGQGGLFHNMSRKDIVEGCQANLKQIWRAIQAYAGLHEGRLPNACFFPAPDGSTDNRNRSFARLLGIEGQPFLLCPGSGPEHRAYGLGYLWNERWSGRQLSEIPRSREEWLVMDLVGLNPVVAKRAGHRGGANVLYADGHVALKPSPGGTIVDWRSWAAQVAKQRLDAPKP